MRLGDRQTVEHGTDVVAGALLRIAGTILGHVRWRVAARIERDAAIAPREVTDLRLEAPVIVGELVDKDDRRARPGLLIIQAHTVIGGDMGHRGAFPA